MKAYVFGTILKTFKSNEELLYHMMGKEGNIEDYMRSFAYRATIDRRKIRHDSIDNFVADCHKYGYINIVEK